MSGAIRKRNHSLHDLPHAGVVGAILAILALLVILGHFSPVR